MTDGRRRLAGRYRIDGPLGRGGMSEVYFGYDERLDRRSRSSCSGRRRYVPAAPDSPEAVEILDALDRDQRRFLREIRIDRAAGTARHARRLRHRRGRPAGRDAQLWLVMQLLRGSTLETLLDGASFAGSDTPSVAWAAAIAAQVAAVLADVHRVDIVHRDIKPANVMVTDGGLVKVLDFGIAILRGASALPRLTQVDRTVGTPAYMSPEQWARPAGHPRVGRVLARLPAVRAAHRRRAVPRVAADAAAGRAPGDRRRLRCGRAALGAARG